MIQSIDGLFTTLKIDICRIAKSGSNLSKPCVKRIGFHNAARCVVTQIFLLDFSLHFVNISQRRYLLGSNVTTQQLLPHSSWSKLVLLLGTSFVIHFFIITTDFVFRLLCNYIFQSTEALH